jgi:hypothetical protein
MTSSTPATRPAQGTAMPDIQLRLTLDELNLVLEGIGGLPFARVFALVGKIQAQAGEQLNAQAQTGPQVG